MPTCRRGSCAGSTDYVHVTLYPASGASPVSLCTPNGYDSIVANSMAALVQSYRGMMLCGFDGAGASPFLPYPDYNGVAVRSIAIDETNAYLVHRDSTTADGIYRTHTLGQEPGKVSRAQWARGRSHDAGRNV